MFPTKTTRVKSIFEYSDDTKRVLNVERWTADC